jgi:hypothetical protein
MPTSGSWRPLGAVAPRALVEPRLLLHHAAQLATATGRLLVPPRPDDGHTALEWIEASQALAGERIEGREPWRAALRLADLTLLVLVEATEAAVFPLGGRTLEEGWVWLRDQASLRGADAARLPPQVPCQIPAHALASGARFPSSFQPGWAELARYFANADGLLRAIVAGREGASAVRCWPHHFDVGAVVILDAGQTIGLGLSPGDAAIPEPYWYVNAWPVPASPPDPLPALPAGARWNTDGWLGAVLTATALVEAGDGSAQAKRAGGFLPGAMAAMKGLLGRAAPAH